MNKIHVGNIWKMSKDVDYLGYKMIKLIMKIIKIGGMNKKVAY